MDVHLSNVRFGPFQLNTDQRQLSKDNASIKLGGRTFDVLLALVERRERVVSKDELLKIVWPSLIVEENTLEVHISALRKVLGPTAISTIAGRGYRFTPQIDLDPLPKRLPSSTAQSITLDTEVSLAVLPFTDLSPERDQEYFADGLAEELLNVFCKVRGLRVVSRTSAFSFRGTNLDISAVAKKLNVGNVLEGSIRKIGNRIRIAVHLIHAESDTRLWSESYDRDLKDIFEVQEDIAQAVVTELRQLLEWQSSYRPTYVETSSEVGAALRGRGHDVEAFRLYLQGKHLVNQLRSADDIAEGIKLLQRAVKVDPSFYLGWASLANAYVLMTWLDLTEVSASEAYSRAAEAANVALALEPDLPEAHAMIGWICMNKWDWSGAHASLNKALAVAPTHAPSLRLASMLAQDLGQVEQARILHLKAVALDPLNAVSHNNLANFYLGVGHLSEAETAIKAGLSLRHFALQTHYILGKLRLMQGRVVEAREAFEKTEGSGKMYGLAVTYHAEGRQIDSDNALSALIEQYGQTRPSEVARTYAYRGDVDQAFGWLERAYELRDARLAQLAWEPLLESLHSDSRWPYLLGKLRLQTRVSVE